MTYENKEENFKIFNKCSIKEPFLTQQTHNLQSNSFQTFGTNDMVNDF